MTSFGIQGEVTLSFSEQLYSLDELSSSLDLRVLNIARNEVLNVTYETRASAQQDQSENVIIPELSFWNITDFSSFQMTL